MRSKNGNCVYETYAPHLPQRTTELSLAPGHQGSHISTPTPKTSSTVTPSTLPSYASISSPRATSSTAASTLTGNQSARDIEALKNRVRQLEEQLAKVNRNSSHPPVRNSGPNIETITSRISGTFYVHSEGRAISRSVTHKSREFGQSHWVTGLLQIRDVIDIIEPHVRDETCKVAVLMQKSKSLARCIKARRSPPWPSIPTPHLPPKDVADELVDCYLRTVETTFRILHVPSFKRDYEAHWMSHANHSTGFLVQLKLILAIGATTYDEKFSLRASAMRWVYEAQTWISEPGFKHRLSIQFLQTNLLLLLARELVDVGPDLVWVSSGTVLRTAIYMGLHKDPTHLPKTTTFTAEMRRRIWNTILELSLQSCLTAGGPPIISLDMFDTEPPGNFDDEQLTAEDPIPKPEGDFTQISIALSIRKTFPIRLTIAKFLNDHGSRGTYEETLRLDAELRASYKSVLRTLQGYKLSTGPRPSQLELDIASLITNRFFLSLHVPFFSSALNEAAYAFSRKVVVETSLKIWRTVCPPTSIMAFQASCNTVSDQRDLPRLAVCGSGCFRTVSLQATCMIAVELRTELYEEETLGLGFVRQDLLSILEEAKTSALLCIEAGETSIKGYFLLTLITAQIEGLMQGLRKEELAAFMIKAAEESEEKGLSILEEMAARQQNSAEGPEQAYSISPSQLPDDWDFAISDGLFDFGDAAPINWVFDGVSQEPPFL